MAKQDLVVKLLLDSGAFGNDLRAAERKAQQFSNNMQNAGKTAGDLGRELNLTTGALGKLGGMLTGAGAVVASFGAFKSVMESTHETSKKFHGALDGISGVFKEIQESLAKMDFDKWNNMMTIYQSYKNASISNADLGISQISYDMLNADNMKEVKKLMADFSVATTKEAKQKIKDEMLGILDTMLGQFENLSNEIDSNVIKNIIAGSKITESQISSDFAIAQIKKVNEFNNAGKRDEDLASYATVKAELDRLYGQYEAYVNLSQDELRLAGENLFGRKTHLNNYETYKQKSSDFHTQWSDYFNKNLDILFRKQLYDMTQEDFGKIAGKVMGADNEEQRLAELRREISGMPVEVQQVKTGGSSGGGKDEIKNAKDSIGWLKDQISKQEQLRNSVVQGSADWEKYTNKLYEHKAALAAAMKEQEKYDAQFITTTKPYADDSIASIQNQISEQQKLINTLEYGSIEWRAAVALLVQYNGELDKMMENLKKVQDEMGAPVKIKAEEGSLNKLKEEIAEMQELVDKAEATRDSYTYGSDKWEAASEAVDEYMTKLGVLMDMMKQMQEDPTAKKYENLTKANVALATTISLVDSLGVAFSNAEDQSTRNLQGMTNIISSLASAAMGLIEIYKASGIAAGTASAAAMPFPYNLAAIATVVSTLLSIYSNADKMKKKKFAEGGIVGGTSYSGDKLFAMVNSGEMILNKRQQGNLANMIGGGGGQVEFHISGDALVGVLNNKRNKTNLTR